MNLDLNVEYNNIDDDDVYVCQHTPSPINHEIPVHHTVGEVQKYWWGGGGLQLGVGVVTKGQAN